ncbi:MAG TPA: hypothetical protein VFS43_35470 [Polyangiaceae bacterium]|nr:hypothetical protein [Polyangiaceae bacterium]
MVLGVSTALGLLSATAAASGEYPGTIKAALDASAAPPCNICHNSPGGGDTITGKFGLAMKNEGLTGGSAFKAEDDMLKLLNALGEAADSDDGGQPDIEELKVGQNPSDDSDDESGGGGGSGGGASGSGGGGTGGGGNNGSGGGGGDEDDDSGSGGNPGTGQATSAGCSYGVLDSSTNTGTVASLLGAAGIAVAMARRRKRH